MILEVDEKVLYYSTFDENTGTVVRSVEALKSGRRNFWDLTKEEQNKLEATRDLFRKKFPKRGDTVCSPSPELIDIAITNKCDFGCSYCYQDSKAKSPHGRKDLVETVLSGFDYVPYQIAIGGGEPTMHPDFVEILYKAKELGTIPNYTTAGHKITPEILKATDEVCGGVAMTFHAFKGLEWFKKNYKNLRENLKCQVNVHLIADKDVATNMEHLIEAQKEIGTLSVVLLAYYPEVGRANLTNLMTKTTYNKKLPDLLKKAIESGMQLSFSEGLLPYFLSRPEIGINCQLATTSEGIYSCYIDSDGHMAKSSFEAGSDNFSVKTVYEASPQELWGELRTGWNHGGDECYDCKHKLRCSIPTDFHYLICAYARHN